ncbi:hypothetical protein CYFUS_008081 [Cystobacter fuscus]|uniref:Uncharacterized protein n=1 Tax=Cystobacter fuscus TaxID=43 RepID=A0A250JGK1_9BACT|nr:hypothetical protein [Cystobacter fuscus]ATB42602.1 hypothetical protein CYFUS_008081 [Cystobacter fuscus]
MTDEISAGLRRFATLLDRLCPRHRRMRQHCQLEKDAPRYVREFWEAVGWSDAVGGGGDSPRTLRPERAASRSYMQECFEAWFENAEIRDAWGAEPGDFSAAWKRLPEKFRVIAPSEYGSALIDETTGENDPLVHELKPTRAQLVKQPEHFLDHVIRSTLERVMGKRKAAAYVQKPWGEPILGAAFPGLRELAEGIWGVDRSPRAPAHLLNGMQMIYYESFEGYIDFILKQPSELLPGFGPPSGQTFLLEPSSKFDPGSLAEPGFLRFETTTPPPLRRQVKHAVGRIEGRGVWLSTNNKSSTLWLTVAPENLKVTLDWIKHNKLELQEPPTPLPPDLWASDAS